MSLDLSEIFSRYEQLVASVDQVFDRVRQAHGDLVTCKPGCSDCCHAVFDLRLVEALYLNAQFNARFQGLERDRVLVRADEAERTQAKLVRKAHKRSQKGVEAEEILSDIARVRIRCPLLGTEGVCELYEHRPITCRLYGIPLNIAGEAHTCGLSGFVPGTPYPAVNVEKIHERLRQLSFDALAAVGSTTGDLADLLVPVGAALMNTYDEAHLGVKKKGIDAVSGAEDAPAGEPAAQAAPAAAAPSRPPRMSPQMAAARGGTPPAGEPAAKCGHAASSQGCAPSDCASCARGAQCGGGPVVFEVGGGE